MKAVEANLLALMQKSPQFAIPIYQRTYSWAESECRQLWDDIIRVGRDNATPAHFIGSIVYIEKGQYQISAHQPLLVIDGQQRLTTVTLLVAALAEALAANGETFEPVDGYSEIKLRHYFLLNPLEAGERRFKLILSQTDKQSLIAIVGGLDQPPNPSQRITENFQLFKIWMAGLHGDYGPFCKGLSKLLVVDVALSRDHDNPQLIFESMNSTGRKLSQADLIRNYVLMGLEQGDQAHLYNHYWRPMEELFGQAAYTDQFDSFMRHYLTVKTGDIPRIDDVYDAFKGYATWTPVAEAGVEALLADVARYAGYYCVLALGKEADPHLKQAFADLREYRVDVAYPFLLAMYHDYAEDVLTAGEFVAATRLVESYVFRRAICEIPTNSLNRTFATFRKAIDSAHYLESVRAHFRSLASYRRFPNDDEFRQAIQIHDLYNMPRRSYWLRRLENGDSKETANVNQYTIEHIMPQNPNPSSEWQHALGPDWKRVQATWLHTLGNLTLTGYNSQYSDLSFPEKRDMKHGFAQSPLRLNQGLGQIAQWNEQTIQTRAAKLADMAIEVWPAPPLPAGMTIAPKPLATSAGYSLADHPALQHGPMSSLYRTFRQEVLALDPSVREEFLKLYVAYKAETNFVDVIPQASKLQLTLNMPFADLYDPQGIAEDVTSASKWGNGSVRVALSSNAELPYILGLVRQSLDRQLGPGDDA